MANKITYLLAAGISFLLLQGFSGATASAGQLIEYRNEKFGFSLRLPADQFVEGTSRNPEVGTLWISRDRLARLIAVASPNETGGSIESYRAFVMKNTYAGARFDYTPQRENWFVLSGIKGDQIFYERITFVCGDRYIYGWQLFYPIRQKHLYDQIVEQIHRDYRVGNGEDGRCG
jgi:hypothetical protein